MSPAGVRGRLEVSIRHKSFQAASGGRLHVLDQMALRLASGEVGALVGPSGAGHFAKMIHNGIEYGMMQSYAEGFELLRASDYDYDLAGLAHLWNQGSVVRSWLLELTADVLKANPGLDGLKPWVEDSGEGRWTVQAAIDENVPAPVTAVALFNRFSSRQEESFSAKVIAALRNEFGGHAVKTEEGEG